MNDSIVGNWLLIDIQKNQMAQGAKNKFTDLEKHQVIYNFKNNGSLIVTGDTVLVHTPGTYNYNLEKDYIGLPLENQANELLLSIDNSKWSFTKKNNEIKIGQAFLDGPELTLKRKLN
ncbi:hypothetical protein [uncultured Planktosalinus sp.]|uniref:hypothetical protein n=1 Tax=uncultured Planktosalinus sp. TaxID=1810935 RepID=UPI0030DA6926